MDYEFIPVAAAQRLYENTGRPIDCGADSQTARISSMETE